MSSSPPATEPSHVLVRLRSGLPSLQPGDAAVVEAILRDPAGAVYRSVSEMAEVAGVSTATVVRSAQKLGFKGFQHLKLALAQDLATFASPKPGATRRDGLQHLQRVIDSGMRVVAEAGALIDPATFRAVAVATARARIVAFCGVGTSGPLVLDAGYRFRTIGLHTAASLDVHDQHVTARLLGPEDVCIAISHSGATSETLAIAGAAKEAGATTVALSTYLRSPLTDLVDHALTAGAVEVEHRLEAIASRLAHLTILDALLADVSARLGDRASDALDAYAAVVAEHRL